MSIRRRLIDTLCLVLAAAMLAGATGCASGKSDKWKFAKSLDPRRAFGSKSDEPREPQIPRRLVATWVDTTLHTPGQKPMRGFGGRMVFFGDQGQDSVRVDGELVVYAFDETDRPTHETHPTRRYIFPAEQFVKHESSSRFGPSYSVWLPWDEVGGEQKRISLIARFEPQGGAMIVGEQTAHLLPGIVRPERAMADTAAPNASGVQLTNYTDHRDPVADRAAELAAQRRGTTTIDLPAGLAERMASAKPVARLESSRSGETAASLRNFAPPTRRGTATASPAGTAQPTASWPSNPWPVTTLPTSAPVNPPTAFLQAATPAQGAATPAAHSPAVSAAQPSSWQWPAGPATATTPGRPLAGSLPQTLPAR